MSVPEINGPHGPYTPATNQTGTQISEALLDTMAAALPGQISSLQPEKGITIAEYHRIVSTALQNFKSLQQQFSRFLSEILKSAGTLASEEARNLIQKSGGAETSNSLRSLNSTQNTQLTPLITMQNEYAALLQTDNEEIQKYNDAVAQYNLDGNLQAYELAKNDFRNYINNERGNLLAKRAEYISAVNTYNDNAVDAYNAGIEALNQIRLQASLEPFPEIQDVQAPPSLTTIPSLPGAGIPPSGTISLDSTDLDLQQLLDIPELQDVFNIILENGKIFSNLSEAINNLRGALNPDAESYGDTSLSSNTRSRSGVPLLFINGGPGVSPELGTMIIGLDSPFLGEQLSTALFRSLLHQQEMAFSKEAFDRLRIFNLGLISTSSLSTAVPAAGELAEILGVIKPNNPILADSLAFAFAGRTLDIINSGQVSEGLLTLFNGISAFDSLSDNQKSALLQNVASATELTLINFSVSQLATTLGLEGFAPQFFAAIPSLANYSEAIGAGSVSTYRDVLENPYALAFIKLSLRDALLSTGEIISPRQANLLINKTVNEVVLDEFAKSQEQISVRLKEELSKSGLSESAANSLLSVAEKVLEEERSLNLDRRIGPKTPQDLAALANNPPGLAEAIASASGIVTVRDFRDLVAEHTKNRDLANNAVAALNPSGPLLDAAISDGRLSTAKLQAASKEAVLGKLTPLAGSQTAGKLAERLGQIVSAYTERADSQIATLKDALGDKGLDDYVEGLRAHYKPYVSLHAFHSRMLDPANNLLLSMQNGITYSPVVNSLPDSSMGGGGNRELDFRV